MRTIEALRNSREGKVYVRFSSEEMFRRVLEDAETEGYMVGDKKPTEAGLKWDRLAVLDDKMICGVGAMGHMAYQAGAAFVVDYEKYVNGDDEYDAVR